MFPALPAPTRENCGIRIGPHSRHALDAFNVHDTNKDSMVPHPSRGQPPGAVNLEV
ncbi:hypothetical protein BS47DRAFT_1337047 [Hydnum rufescens UP504]|uniref:Uncharacterized protein n=1 Tax=Hydnum rufescens UP504 TaxID=1448309 RepID=A0A9P6E1H5_9AGAM|nr:hypothetical protein BS47DRAFT_1337047 [Hydnum rufescens UP504]